LKKNPAVHKQPIHIAEQPLGRLPFASASRI
jgi:hypothetical protein